MAYAFDQETPINLTNAAQDLVTSGTVEWHGEVRLVNTSGAQRTVTINRKIASTSYAILYQKVLNAGEVYQVGPIQLESGEKITGILAANTDVWAFVQYVKGP